MPNLDFVFGSRRVSRDSARRSIASSIVRVGFSLGVALAISACSVPLPSGGGASSSAGGPPALSSGEVRAQSVEARCAVGDLVDVDGDGEADRVRLAELSDGGVLTVCTAAGQQTTIAAAAFGDYLEPFDLDDDGSVHIVFGGASARGMTGEVAEFVNGRLRKIRDEDGEPLQLSERAGSLGADAAADDVDYAWGCGDVNEDGDRELVQISGTRSGDTVSVNWTAWSVADGVATVVLDERTTETVVDGVWDAADTVGSCNEMDLDLDDASADDSPAEVETSVVE